MFRKVMLCVLMGLVGLSAMAAGVDRSLLVLLGGLALLGWWGSGRRG